MCDAMSRAIETVVVAADAVGLVSAQVCFSSAASDVEALKAALSHGGGGGARMLTRPISPLVYEAFSYLSY